MEKKPFEIKLFCFSQILNYGLFCLSLKHTIKQLGGDISFLLFTEFQDYASPSFTGYLPDSSDKKDIAVQIFPLAYTIHFILRINILSQKRECRLFYQAFGSCLSLHFDKQNQQVSMERIIETADCKSLRLFLWNEKPARNQISQSEGLCLFIIRSTFMMFHPCECGCYKSKYSRYTLEEKKCSTVIPFDLSKLRNRETSLGSLLVSATLQFLPQTIKQLGDDISFCLFTEFQNSQALLPLPRRTYVVVVEIFQTRCVNFTDKVDLDTSPNFTGYPPDAPLYCRFENDDKEEEEVVTVRNVSAADDRNDPFCKYTEDVLEYIDMFRECTGEGEGYPMKPPIAVDVASGFVEVPPCYRSWCSSPAISIKDPMNETCPVCQEELKDENEVITTCCSHMIHTSCLLPWLSKNNTCPTCRAVYPLHYSPLLDHQHCKRTRNMLEASV
ncbi:uncharacterized protein [Solanum tuberosum]|uniref:uncharacterized protein n=1 Tax=Solanum tuberosum TaxID=4113 RepID=UPI00073A2C95|nr:PREDICTED: uncharacterized protein LOC102584132 [Solanum tuberosum]